MGCCGFFCHLRCLGIVAVVIALGAGILMANVPQDFEARWKIFQLFADFSAPIRQDRSLPQAVTRFIIEVMLDLDTL